MITKYSDDELIYAAYSRCPCGAGMAYVKNPSSDMRYWDCSNILKGIADVKVMHTGELPFAFYEVKSENQPSAYGATTRPKSDDINSPRQFFE